MNIIQFKFEIRNTWQTTKWRDICKDNTRNWQGGFIDERNIFIDGTHIKANVNTRKYENAVIEKSTKFYEEELIKEINVDRAKHNKKPLKKEQRPKTKNVKVSTVDPEYGIFHKGERNVVFDCNANLTCDINNYINWK